MSSKTVNEDLRIVTMGSKHICDTKKPTDECFYKGKKKTGKWRNHIPTSACDNKEATQKTLIRGYRIIHSASRIGQDYGLIASADDNFQGFGGGCHNGGVFYKHSNDYPGSHSKNVKVEGQWIVRTDDETQQNKKNTTGKFLEGDAKITEDDLEALLNKGCTVESVSTKCEHRDTTVDRICVIEGDKVTITMVHVNDAEVDPAARKKPQCQVPRRKAQGKLPKDAKEHPYFRVTRSAYEKTDWREAMPAKTKEIPGLTVVIGAEWIGGKEEDEKSKAQWFKDQKQKPKVTTYDSDKNLGQVKGDPPLEGARMLRDQKEDDTHIPAQQARGRQEANQQLSRDMENRSLREDIANRNQQGIKDKIAERKKNEAELDEGREASQAVKKTATLALESYKAFKNLWGAKPVEVKVEALACAGAKAVTIAAYPPGKYEGELTKWREFVAAWKAIKETVAGIRAFFGKVDGAGEKEEGAGAEVSINTPRFAVQLWVLKDIFVALDLEYKELTRDANQDGEKKGRKKHEVFLCFGVDLKCERLIGVKISWSIPLSAATGAIGPFFQACLDYIHADLSFKVEVELSVGVNARIEYDEYGKLNWKRRVEVKPVVVFTFSLNASGEGFTFAMGIKIEWKPNFQLEPVLEQPLVVKRLKSNVDIKWFVKAAVKILGWTVDFEYGDTIWQIPLDEQKYAFS